MRAGPPPPLLLLTIVNLRILLNANHLYIIQASLPSLPQSPVVPNFIARFVKLAAFAGLFDLVGSIRFF